jgi:hypothetical protein
MRKLARLSLAALLSFTALPLQAAADPTFLAEDWIGSYEATQPDSWGVQWGLNNFMLPFRLTQRGKHWLEDRYTHNWNFSSDSPKAGGVLMRLFVGTGVDFALFMGPQNIHHQMGHDAAAREFSRQWDLGDVPKRFGQVLPKYFPKGGPLDDDERRTGGGPDAQTQYMVQPMQMELQFAYQSGKNILERSASNRNEVENFLLYRLRHMTDWFDEHATVDQGFSDYLVKSNPTDAERHYYDDGGNGFSTDYTDYIVSLNRARYGVTQVGDYKVGMEDLGRSHLIQMLDPLFLASAWSYGRDYLVDGKNQVAVPMLNLSQQVKYLPSFRIFFSPFGIDYFQDNYLRFRGSLTNIFWTIGDNGYQKRYGGGFDIENIVCHRVRIGVFGMADRQPFLSRVNERTALTAREMSEGHIALNGGASLKILLRRLPGENEEGLFLYTRAGAKNTSWFPGEYFSGGPYVQVGLGLRW